MFYFTCWPCMWVFIALNHHGRGMFVLQPFGEDHGRPVALSGGSATISVSCEMLTSPLRAHLEAQRVSWVRAESTACMCIRSKDTVPSFSLFVCIVRPCSPLGSMSHCGSGMQNDVFFKCRKSDHLQQVMLSVWNVICQAHSCVPCSRAIAGWAISGFMTTSTFTNFGHVLPLSIFVWTAGLQDFLAPVPLPQRRVR